LENKLKIKRGKTTVTILILIVFSLVFLVSQVHLIIYQRNVIFLTSVFNETLNQTVSIRARILICEQANPKIVLAQDMIYIIMRIILPFVIMVVCNTVLINYISKSRQVLVSSLRERKEQNFTLVVAIMNMSFLVCNIAVIVYYFMLYYYSFTGSILDIVPFYINKIFGTSVILFSYIFTFSQFFIDFIFNKVFRKEILAALSFLFDLGQKMLQFTSRSIIRSGTRNQAQTQTQTQTRTQNLN
jgi:hypothetical protein